MPPKSSAESVCCRALSARDDCAPSAGAAAAGSDGEDDVRVAFLRCVGVDGECASLPLAAEGAVDVFSAAPLALFKGDCSNKAAEEVEGGGCECADVVAQAVAAAPFATAVAFDGCKESELN
jgi:hypothetical protein